MYSDILYHRKMKEPEAQSIDVDPWRSSDELGQTPEQVSG